VNEVIKFIQLEGGQEGVPALWTLLVALTITLLCSLVIGMVYRATTTTPGYSQSFVQTLVLTSLVTAVIMLVIGSNLARAFSLVGALSIVRFRNAVKETRDVGFIFFSLSIAMAAGTRFFSIAVLSTMFINLTVLAMHYFSFGDNRQVPQRMLKVRFPAGGDPLGLLKPVLEQHFSEYQLVLLETARQGMFVDVVLSVREKEGMESDAMLAALARVNGNNQIVFRYDFHTENA
jgi:hypothetical protein